MTRDSLAEDGLELRLFGTIDFSLAALGREQRTGAWVLRGLLDASATFDGERMLGWRGGTVHFGVQALVGQPGDMLIGDLQTFDNIDASPFVGLTEVWIQQVVLDGRLRFKLGRIEANSEFTSVEEGAVQQAVRARRTFLHSSMGFSPTMVRMPSYPRQSLGGVADADPADWLDVAVGVFDATHEPPVLSSIDDPSTNVPFSTAFFIGEFDVGWALGRTKRVGRIGGGGWGLLGDEACDLPPCASRATGGAFVLASQTLWKRLHTDQGVSLFVQYGWAPPEATDIRHHAGGGVVWTGLHRRRPADMLGAGASWIGLEGNLHGETAVELFYRGVVQRNVWLQPDLQYVARPGGTTPDGFVISLRIALDL